MTKKLNMVFKTTDNKNATISLADPRDDLSRAEVEAVMQAILDKKVFTTSKQVELASISEITLKTTDEIELA